jgi:hypothetical protein
MCNEEDLVSVVCENDSVSPRKEILLIVKILNPTPISTVSRIEILFPTIAIANF